MTNPKEMGIQDVRQEFRAVVDRALERGEITVVQRFNRPVVAVVPFEWYQRASAALAKEQQEPE